MLVFSLGFVIEFSDSVHVLNIILYFIRGGARSLSEVRQISHWYAFV